MYHFRKKLLNLVLVVLLGGVIAIAVTTSLNEPGSKLEQDGTLGHTTLALINEHSLTKSPGKNNINENQKTTTMRYSLASEKGFYVLSAFGELAEISPSGIVLNKVDTNVDVAENPNTLAISPALNEAVFPSTNSPLNAIMVVNLERFQLIDTIKLNFTPIALAIDPIGEKNVLVTGASGELAEISLVSNSVVRQVVLVNDPNSYLDAIAITPNGQDAVVLDAGKSPSTNLAILLNVSTLTPYREVSLTNDPGAFLDAVAISPDGKSAWALNGGYGDGFVSEISLPYGVVSQPVPCGGGPLAIGIDENNSTAYVVDGNTGYGNLIVPINMAGAEENLSETGGTPYEVDPNHNLYLDAISVDANANTLYVLDRNSSNIYPVNIETSLVSKPIKTIAYPIDLIRIG